MTEPWHFTTGVDLLDHWQTLVAGLLALGVIAFYEEVLHFRFLWALFAIVAVLGKDARALRRA